MKKTITIAIVIISVIILGAWVIASESDQPANEKITPSLQAYEKAQKLVKEKFPEDAKILRPVKSPDDITYESDSAVFSVTNDGNKIKNIEFRNVSFDGKKIIDDTQALKIDVCRI